jgi:hypothetical protein
MNKQFETLKKMNKQLEILMKELNHKKKEYEDSIYVEQELLSGNQTLTDYYQEELLSLIAKITYIYYNVKG